MSNKTRTKGILIMLVKQAKPFLAALAVFLLLKLTGLNVPLSEATHRTLLYAGFFNAGTEPEAKEEEFNYDFTLKDLQGNRVHFSQFKGKTIFLNLWATWCGPCRAEMPSIQALYDKVDKEKIEFVMLSLDRDTDLQRVTNFMTSRSFTFTAYMPSGQLADHLNVPYIPTTFIISPEGKVVRKEVGGTQFDTEKFKKFLEGLGK